MLTYLSVKNFAIIENVEVTFEPGMTALTGETGAGKSLLIDAIGLLLGDRATSNIVRTGADKAEVEGVFRIQSEDIRDLLQDLDIDADEELVIRRQITPTANNIIKLNGTTVTLKDLREVTGKLADIHTQIDTHRLINQDTYIDIIDGFERPKMEALLANYHQALAAYKASWRELRRLERSNDDLAERLDLLRFQKKELEGYGLDPDEEADLTEQVEKMEHYDTIFQTMQSIRQRLEEFDALGMVYDAAKDLGKIASLSESYQDLQQRFESHYYELDDAFETLKQELASLDFDPRLLDEYQERLNRLDALKRKYRKSVPELIEYLHEISADINNVDHYDDVIAAQRKRLQAAFQDTCEKAAELTALRQQTSRYIEEKLLAILGDLELPDTRFEIAFSQASPSDPNDPSVFFDHGVDEVDFLLSTNVGEPLKPLSKSASGGEMSRIMLGFKNLLATSLNLALMIFDEIDSGVSGYVANQVAKKMKAIAKATQVICITHIPQVASTSDHHLRIHKEVVNDRTIAKIDRLEGASRVREIAAMLSGDKITDAALNSATELLNQ